MSEIKVFPVPEDLAKSAWCDEAQYVKLYEQSVNDPEGFWGEQGKRLHWFKPFSKVKDVSFGPGDIHIKWFHDGTTNACYNCVDRHLPTQKRRPRSPSSGRATTPRSTEQVHHLQASSTRTWRAWPTP